MCKYCIVFHLYWRHGIWRLANIALPGAHVWFDIKIERVKEPPNAVGLVGEMATWKSNLPSSGNRWLLLWLSSGVISVVHRPTDKTHSFSNCSSVPGIRAQGKSRNDCSNSNHLQFPNRVQPISVLITWYTQIFYQFFACFRVCQRRNVTIILNFSYRLMILFMEERKILDQNEIKIHLIFRYRIINVYRSNAEHNSFNRPGGSFYLHYW